MIEIVLANGPNDIVLAKYNARNFKANTQPCFYLTFNAGDAIARLLKGLFAGQLTPQRIRLLEEYQVKNYNETLPELVFSTLTRTFCDYLEQIELQYKSNNDGTALRLDFYFPRLNKNLCDVFDDLQKYYTYIMPRVERPKQMNIDDVKSSIFDKIASTITILTQDRGLTTNSSLSQIYNYPKAIKSIKHFSNIEQLDYLNDLLEDLTDYTIEVKCTITELLQDISDYHEDIVNMNFIDDSTVKDQSVLKKVTEMLQPTSIRLNRLKNDFYEYKSVEEMKAILLEDEINNDELQTVLTQVFKCVVDCSDWNKTK